MTVVTAAYRHAPKQAAAVQPLEIGGSRLKWYHVEREPGTITAALADEARRRLVEDARAGRLALSDDCGFVLLHHCTSVAFLIVCVWRNENELWKTVYIKDLASDGGFEEQVYRGVAPAFCVWELGVVCHEQQAWTRYLYSDRNPVALLGYLADELRGAV
jgi:hypothetical protein